MDLTTLLLGVLVALGAMGTDIALNSGGIVVEVVNPPKAAKIDVDQNTTQLVFDGLLSQMVSHRSVHPPELVGSLEKGAGLTLAETLSLDRVVYAVQGELGLSPDRIRLSFYVDLDGSLRAWVSVSHSGVVFQRTFTPRKDEDFLIFVRRCAIWALSEIAPYSTAVYLMTEHVSDKDFAEVIAMLNDLKVKLPPTSFERSNYDNLLGLVALFENDLKGAEVAFAKAMMADPTNPVPFINAAFVDLQLDDRLKAASRMEELIRLAPPDSPALVSSAYMTWAAALMGLHQLDGADRLLLAATQANPVAATYGLWAEEKRFEGDEKTAGWYERLALETSAGSQNYAELAALYFHLSWQDNEPVRQSSFFNPPVSYQ